MSIMHTPIVVDLPGLLVVELHTDPLVSVALEAVELPDEELLVHVLVNGCPVRRVVLGQA